MPLESFYQGGRENWTNVEAHRECLMVSARFYPVVGGAERQAYKLAKALTAQESSVEVVTGQTTCLAPIRDQLDGIHVTRLFAYSFYVVGLMSWLWFHRNQYDLIHVHQLVYPAWAAGRIGTWLKKPVIAKAGNSGPVNIRLRPIIADSRTRHGSVNARLLDRVIATSQAIAQDLVAAGFVERQITRVPNGVELPQRVNAGPMRECADTVRPLRKRADYRMYWASAPEEKRPQ